MTTAIRSQLSRLSAPRITALVFSATLLAAAFPTPARTASEFVDGVAALVNDKAVTVGAVLSAMEPARRRLIRRYEGQELMDQLQAVYSNTLDVLIDQRLIVAEYEASQSRMKINEGAVQRRMAEILHETFNDDRPALMRELSAEGMTFDDWRKEVENQIVVSAMRYENVLSKANASPAAVDEFYRSHRAQFLTPGRVKLRVIVINRGDSPEAAAAHRQEAEEIRRQIVSGGSFEELAKAKSFDRSAAKGGEWGWMETGLLRQELADAARRIERGGISEVIEVGDAFYILKLEDREDEKLMPLEIARPEIQRQLEKTEAERLYRQWIRRLRDAAFIRIVRPNLPLNVSP